MIGVFQYVRCGGDDVTQLAKVCAEIVDYWNDLALYFGTHRPNVTSELLVITPLEKQVFDDAMVRPRFAVLRVVLDLSEYNYRVLE